jgi:hypothetical protein
MHHYVWGGCTGRTDYAPLCLGGGCTGLKLKRHNRLTCQEKELTIYVSAPSLESSVRLHQPLVIQSWNLAHLTQ